MTENQNGYHEQSPWEEGAGWRVLDPEGNVISSGPGIEMHMSAGVGEILDAVESMLSPEIKES